MKYNTRIIFSDNGVFSDYTQELNDFRSGSATLSIIASEDSIYVGSLLPFNHLYFEIGTANDQTSNIKIQNWWALAWHDTLDLLDGTKASGKTLAQNGTIEWSPDSWQGWDRWSRNSSNNFPLYTLNIFDFYWIKITFSASLKSTTALKYIGHKFSTDSQLFSFYPDLNNTALRTAFASGKTNWDEQTYIAANEIEDYLNRVNLITTKDQLLDSSLFEKASIHKTAELIYFGLGKDYVPHMTRARTRFKESMDLKSLRIDKNLDANLTGCDISNNVGELYR